MPRGTDLQHAWDRYTEEVDLTEFLTKEEAWESFINWLNPEAGKYKGLEPIQEFFSKRWKEWIEELPIEEKVIRSFITEYEEYKPKEIIEKYKTAYERALEAESLKKAWGKFWGTLPYAERRTKEARSLWENVRKLFL